MAGRGDDQPDPRAPPPPRPGPAPLEEYDRADPGAEFVEVALSRLHFAQQRREADEAARWLDPADRELLALWALERVGS